jgi:hypothetical protein
VQWNNSGSFGGFTVNGDGALNTTTGALTITKTGGVAFGSLATQSSVNLATQVTGLGTGVATALGNAANSASGFPTVNGSPLVGHMLQWSAAGLLDAGVAARLPQVPGSGLGL